MAHLPLALLREDLRLRYVHPVPSHSQLQLPLPAVPGPRLLVPGDYQGTLVTTLCYANVFIPSLWLGSNFSGKLGYAVKLPSFSVSLTCTSYSSQLESCSSFRCSYSYISIIYSYRAGLPDGATRVNSCSRQLHNQGLNFKLKKTLKRFGYVRLTLWDGSMSTTKMECALYIDYENER